MLETGSYHTHICPNGLRIIHAPLATPVVYCGFAIDAGSRDELPHEQGMAHYVEHMLFKGTATHDAWYILNRMEAVGGDLNAFTNKEETMVYCAHLPQDFARAVALLSDIVFHSLFPEEEMEREVEVIADEIDSYEDTPSELIFDEFDEVLFPHHPLGRNILGQAEQLRRYDSRALKAFVRRNYRPERMVFFVQGPVDFRQVVRLVERYAGEALMEAEGERTPRVAPTPASSAIVRKSRGTHQTHTLIGASAYEALHPHRTALCLLTNILGGPGMNSRLNVILRERRGWVYNVEANLTSYTDTGAFTIYYGCDRDDNEHCRLAVMKELERLCEKPVNEAQFKAAKRQLIGQIGVSADNFENLALDMAKIYLHYNRYEEREEVFRRIRALTAQELLEVASDIFAPSKLSRLEYFG